MFCHEIDFPMWNSASMRNFTDDLWHVSTSSDIFYVSKFIICLIRLTRKYSSNFSCGKMKRFSKIWDIKSSSPHETDCETQMNISTSFWNKLKKKFSELRYQLLIGKTFFLLLNVTLISNHPPQMKQIPASALIENDKTICEWSLPSGPESCGDWLSWNFCRALAWLECERSHALTFFHYKHSANENSNIAAKELWKQFHVLSSVTSSIQG